MVLTVWLYAFLLAVLAVALAWVTRIPEPAAAARVAPLDPHEAQVREFRRQVADWDGAR